MPARKPRRCCNVSCTIAMGYDPRPSGNPVKTPAEKSAERRACLHGKQGTSGTIDTLRDLLSIAKLERGSAYLHGCRSCSHSIISSASMDASIRPIAAFFACSYRCDASRLRVSERKRRRRRAAGATAMAMTSAQRCIHRAGRGCRDRRDRRDGGSRCCGVGRRAVTVTVTADAIPLLASIY